MESRLDAFQSAASGDLRPCAVCGRTFNTQSLAKHQPICEKSNNSRRKVFESAKQRAYGSEEKQVPATVLVKQKGRKPEPPVKKSNWRQKHEDFINILRSAKQTQHAIATGGPLPPPPPPSINPDYIQCQYCDRRFKQEAAERHIPFCKEQHSRLPRGVTVNKTTQQRKDARSYQPPKPKLSSSQGTAAAAAPSAKGLRTTGEYSMGDTNRSAGAGRGAMTTAKRQPARALAGRGAQSGSSAFCSQCGTKYLSASSKFCGECGMKRLTIS